MEFEIICSNCSSSSNHRNKTSLDELDDKENNVDFETCSQCKLLVQSRFNNQQHRNNDEDKSTTIDLPLQSIFIHLNEQILYESHRKLLTNDNSSTPQSALSSSSSSLSDKNVLLIGFGGIKRLPVLNSIKRMNLKRLVCLARETSWATRFVDDWILAEHENLEEREETLRRIVAYELENQMKFDAILTYDDFCILMASYLQEKFEMPGIPLPFLEKIKNKFEFRRMCNKLQISAPKFFLLNYDDMPMYARKFSEPVLNNENNEYVYDLKNYEMVNSSDDDRQRIGFPIIVKNIYGCGKGKIIIFYIFF